MKKLANDRINKVAEFAREYLKASAIKNGYSDVDFNFRWKHSMRVANYGKKIAMAENGDVEVVITACLLHDICKFNTKKGKNHGRKAAKVSRLFLSKLEYSEDQLDNICYCIASHVNGNAGFDYPYTIEAKATWDADDIDKFGTFRVLKKALSNTKRLNKCIKIIKKKIRKIERHIEKDKMQTETGKEIIKIQLQKQINLYNYLEKEKNISKIPEL